MEIKIMLWYDVEDYITPEADDALDGLIDMMNQRGIQSSLKFVADKARVLRDRGRTSLIKKLSGHEICYHTDSHSRHPTVTEYLEDYGFADGAREFIRQEEKGLYDVTDITGQHSTSYGQAGASWAPQTFPVLRRWGIPTYLDSHDVIDVNGKPFWYVGILNLTRLDATMRMELGDEKSLEKAKKQFDSICMEEYGQTLLVSIFYHPCEFSGTEFWDGVNFSSGKNKPKSEWKPSRLREPGEMQRLIDMLGRFIDYTLTKENVEYITASQSLNYEIINKSKLTPPQIKKAFAETDGKVNFAEIGGNWYSASELMSLMVKYLDGKHLTPILSYGPEKAIESNICGTLQVGELVRAFNEQFDRVFGYKQLPSLYKINESSLNPVDMFCTLAAAVSRGLSKDDLVEPVKGELITSKYVRNNDNWGNNWIIFPKDLRVPNIIRMAKLQTWTLKPARF